MAGAPLLEVLARVKNAQQPISSSSSSSVAAAAVASPAAAAPPPVPESSLGRLAAFATYGVAPEIVKPLCILARALHMAAGLDLSLDAYSLVRLVVTAYGGGILAPILLGARPTPLLVDFIILSATLALLLFTCGTTFSWIYNAAPVKVVGLSLEAMFRVNLIGALVKAASSALPSKLGPIVVGCIAGIGGMFLPFTKGIDALKPPLKKPILRVVATSALIAVSYRPSLYGFEDSFFAPPTATALAVAANALYDVVSYLSTSFLFGGKPPATKEEQQPPPKKPTSGDVVFVASVAAVFGGTVAFACTEALGLIDAAYLAACTVSTVGGGSAETPAGKLIAALLSALGSVLFAAGTHRAYAAQVPPGPLAATIVLLATTFLLAHFEPHWSLQDSATYVLSFASTLGTNHLLPTAAETKAALVLFSFVARPALAALVADILNKLFCIRL